MMQKREKGHREQGKSTSHATYPRPGNNERGWTPGKTPSAPAYYAVPQYGGGTPAHRCKIDTCVGIPQPDLKTKRWSCPAEVLHKTQAQDIRHEEKERRTHTWSTNPPVPVCVRVASHCKTSAQTRRRIPIRTVPAPGMPCSCSS